MSTSDLSIPPPKKESSCTEVLSDTLRGYAGIEEVDYDYNTDSLKVVYDPRLLSNESALQVIQKAGQTASIRVAQCAVKREHGSAACANCAGALGRQLAQQYQTAASLPTANFKNNAIEVGLNQPHLVTSENVEIGTSFWGQRQKKKRNPRASGPKSWKWLSRY